MEPGLILFFAFSATLCWGIGDFLIQRTVRKVGNIEALFFIGIIGAVLLIPVVWNELALLTMRNIWILILLGAITFIAAVIDFEALKQGKISVIEVIIELELPLTVIIGFGIFRELFSFYQGLLLIPVFLGIVLMAVKDFGELGKHLKKGLEKGALLGVFTAIGLALVNSLTAYSARTVSPLLAVWVPWVVFMLICFFVILKRGDFKNLMKNSFNFKWLILSMGIMDTAAWLFYAKAVSGYNLGIITAITESYPAVAMFLGFTINKEKVKGYQFFGGVIAIIASIALAYTIL